MNVVRASHLGFCFGVRDALALAKSQPQPLTILGDLVHNEGILQQLRDQGVKTAHQVAQVSTRTVLITAHGTSDRRRSELRRHGFQIVEATCPLVHHAHQTLRSLVHQGFHPVVIGLRHHVEVRGLIGDFDESDVILSEEDIDLMEPRARFGVVAQTTQPVERALRLVGSLRLRFPESEVRWVDTVCQPTKQRQDAAETLARKCRVIVVVGGSHSNNTRELAATCGRYGAQVHHVQGPEELRTEWFEGVELAGLTAGISTPDALIDAVEARMREIRPYEKDQGNQDTEGNQDVSMAGLG